jgi:hypothetical protein
MSNLNHDDVHVTDYYRQVDGLPQYVITHTRRWPRT